MNTILYKIISLLEKCSYYTLGRFVSHIGTFFPEKLYYLLCGCLQAIHLQKYYLFSQRRVKENA